ncbi:oxidoreductase [Clostridium manihotivorum]|uniref:Oxidoreductase n=1 Tax=Clostridium manihotivorum TaxID=2320868 RepID=A0A3R5QT88_9CLOT|nr:oxidoreductase [Clostridium manihotivorum]QAA31801.1 oxidoreductase [Clostridium manihotivorum]
MKRRAVVAGGTGLIGKALVKQLLSDPQYNSITLILRRFIGITDPKLEQKVIDFDLLESIDIDLKDADVFCTLGTTIKKAKTQENFKKVDYHYPLVLGKMAKKQGAKQLLIVTAMGASSTSSIFYNRVKGEIEEALRELNLPILKIFRPSLLLGDRGEFRMGEGMTAALSGLFTPLLLGPLRKYRPIKGEVVARGMIAAAKKDDHGVHTYESNEIAELS